MPDQPVLISDAGAMLGKIAATRALAAATTEVAPADGWRLPVGDVLLRVDAGLPIGADGAADLDAIFVRVRLIDGDEDQAQASGAVSDANGWVENDADGAPHILPPVAIGVAAADVDARDEVLRVATVTTAVAPIRAALEAMQRPAVVPAPLL